ncbi:MAG: hypothetical protein EHM93_12335 [Bacteroidales bacterium]|nr:MAG: hypothetical protein EHM93_12335 [Bacteroidales bacterium]
MKNNPSTNESDLRKGLNKAFADFQDGIKCSCGNDIWVIGSASVGNSCFTCITGESHPIDDYEIDSAIKKSESKKGRRHIDEIDPAKIAGFFDDDGYEINSDLIRKPSICLTCINDDNPKEEMLCNMTRYDQKDDNEFKCFAYKKNK